MENIKPPSPPLDSDRLLHELEDYYQQLVEYHQKAALAAQQKLMHVKALTGNESESEEEENLERLPELSSLKSHENNSEEKSEEITPDNPLTGETSFFFQQLTLPEPTLFPLSAPLGNSEQDVSALSNLTKTDLVSESMESYSRVIDVDLLAEPTESELSQPEAAQRTVNETQLTSKEEIIQQIEDILEEDVGKAVHLDYIIRKIRGFVLEQDMVSARDEFRLLLKHGVSIGKWDKVPDSPNCWTIRLKEMPEFSEDRDESDEFNLSSQSANQQRDSSLQEWQWESCLRPRYQGIPLIKAVEKLLNTYPERSFSKEELVKEMCENLADESQEEVMLQKIGKALTNGCGKKRWVRVSLKPSKYRVKSS